MVKNLPAIQETCVQSLGWKIPWRREWQPTPVLLPGESHGQRSLSGYSQQGHKESDTTERLTFWASQVALVVKNPPASAGDTGDQGLIPGSGRSPGGGHGNPLQYCCLENPMARGAWWATVHGVAKSRSQLKRLSTHACTFNICEVISMYGSVWTH